MSYYDILIVAVIAIFVMIGYSKGLIVSALRFITWILSFVLAKLISPIVAELIINSQFAAPIQSFINERLLYLERTGIQNFSQSLANVQQGKSSGVVDDLILEGLKGGMTLDISNITSYLSLSLSSMMIRIGSMIMVFLVLSIIFGIIVKIAKGFVKLPVIKQLDKVGGVCLGILEGFIIAYVITLLMSIFKMGGIEGEFQNTVLAKYFLNLDWLKQAYLILA